MYEEPYNPTLYNMDGCGINIEIIDLDIGFEEKDIKELNEGINESLIFIYSEPVGGPGGPVGAFIPPEAIEVFQVVIREIIINIFAGFPYDTLKLAIKKIFRKIREKKGNPKEIGFQIEHNDVSFIIIMHDGAVDDQTLDLTLRTILSGIMLKEDRGKSITSSDEIHGVG